MADETNIQELLAALDGEPVSVRLSAIARLAELKAREAVPRLIALLDDADVSVRRAAIRALGDIGDDRAIPALERLVRDDADLGYAAAEALRNIGSPQAKAVLDDLLEADSREQAAQVEKEVRAEAPPKIDLESFAPPSPAPAGPAAPADLEPEDDTAEFVTRAKKPAEREGAPPQPQPIAPPQEATGYGGSANQFEDAPLEDTGAMQPVDWDEKPAAAAPLAPEPAPQPVAAPPPVMAPPPAPARPQQDTDRQRAITVPGGPPSLAQEVQFSAYYPHEIRPGDWQPLQAYIFKQFAADRVAADAEKQIGPLAAFRRIVESARRAVTEGEIITATPQLPGFQFNPPTIAVGFYEDWHRFDFKMRAQDAPLNMAANGFLTFTAGGLIVADIPLSVFVTTEAMTTKPQGTDARPIYDTIFASYSHKDTRVVEKVEAAAKSLGMDYLRDVITLRSGEDWSAGLQNMIDRASIFQMFWSAPYSQSPHCRREWEYAVTLNREAVRFIRPVYWLQPMPDPPPQIAHLHFAYQPDLVQ